MDFSLLKQMVKAYPNNDILIDSNNQYPDFMVYIPKGKLSDVLNTTDNSTHPAFIVNGKEIDGFYVGKYDGCNYNEVLYSLPGEDPANSRNFDQFLSSCQKKGVGYHPMTLAEQAYLALWCKKNGFQPKGNNNYGKDVSESTYKATPTSKDGDKTGRVATGSGPATWYHDGTLAGIDSLNGNVWNIVYGVRLVYGELQVLVNNDAADTDNPQNATSTKWRAINAATGEYMDPENTTSMSQDATYAHSVSVKIAYDSDAIKYTNKLDASKITNGAYKPFASVTADTAVGDAAKLKLRALALLADDGATSSDYNDDGYWMRNDVAENVFYKGGPWSGGSRAGLFGVNCCNGRTHANWDIGARLAYYKEDQ